MHQEVLVDQVEPVNEVQKVHQAHQVMSSIQMVKRLVFQAQLVKLVLQEKPAQTVLEVSKVPSVKLVVQVNNATKP